MRNSNTHKALIGAALLVLGTLVLITYERGQKITHPSGLLSAYQELEKKWEDAFDRSPENAYAEFLVTGKTLSYDDSHKLSHTVGGIIYKKSGVNGVSLCTPDFAFGCYHGFAGAVLEARGLSAIADMRWACDSAGDASVAFGCIHGIGHGILSYLGNGKLTQALEACVPINAGVTIGGCYGGVFMEYNFNTMQSPTGIELRPFLASKAYEPCATEIPAQFREACYYDQASWWSASFGGKDAAASSRYEKTGTLCAAIQETTLRDVCFRGIGNVIGPESGYDYRVMKQWCGTMSSPESRDLCYHEALQHLLQSDKGKAELRTLCGTKEISYANLCPGR